MQNNIFLTKFISILFLLILMFFKSFIEYVFELKFMSTVLLKGYIRKCNHTLNRTKYVNPKINYQNTKMQFIISNLYFKSTKVVFINIYYCWSKIFISLFLILILKFDKKIMLIIFFNKILIPKIINSY